MLTYNECLERIKKARNGRVKLENNTYLYRSGTDFTVVLHNTAVVTVRHNGTFVLNTGGWKTRTTKDRINQFSPARIYQKRGAWYLQDGKEYQDGMVVS